MLLSYFICGEIAVQKKINQLAYKVAYGSTD